MLPVILFTILAAAFIFGVYTNRGGEEANIIDLKNHGFAEHSPFDGPLISKIYKKVRNKFTLVVHEGYDYPKIFKRIFVKETPIGICYALLWHAPKKYETTFHILLSASVPSFFLCRQSSRDEFVAGLHTTSLPYSSGFIAKTQQGVSADSYLFLKPIINFMRGKPYKRIAVTCSGGVLTIHPPLINRRNQHKHLSELVNQLIVTLHESTGNFT